MSARNRPEQAANAGPTDTPIQQLGTLVDEIGLEATYARSLLRLITDHGNRSNQEGFSTTEHGAVIDCLNLVDILLGKIERLAGDDLHAVHRALRDGAK